MRPAVSWQIFQPPKLKPMRQRDLQMPSGTCRDGSRAQAAATRHGILVRLPGDKARPAVVLRSDALARLPYATVVAFTTTVHAEPDLRLRVGPTPENGLQQWSF